MSSSEPPISGDVSPADDLQFEIAEHATPTPAVTRAPVQACAACGRPITSEYFAINNKAICPTCRERFDSRPKGSDVARFGLATLYGAGAALLGAILWFAIRRISGYEIGLVAIAVGFMVGKAVRKGSGNRGGVAFQILAVVLTYCGIAGNYVPDVAQVFVQSYHQRHANDASPEAHIPAATMAILAVYVIKFSFMFPFLGGMDNAIGLLIIGFALWQAWKFNRRRVLPITGPYQLGTAIPGTAVGGSVI